MKEIEKEVVIASAVCSTLGGFIVFALRLRIVLFLRFHSEEYLMRNLCSLRRF